MTWHLTVGIIPRLVRVEGTMAGRGHRVTIKLKSSESPYMYHVKKNKQNTPDRLEIKKYDPVVRKHVMFKEVR